LASTAIAKVAGDGRAHLTQLVESARDYADAGMARNTARAYGSDWADFTSWCASVGASPLPAEAATVALYLTARATTLRVSTLARRIAAVNAAHREEGLSPPASPALAKIWAGIRRTHGRPARKKRGLMTDDLVKVVRKLPKSLAGQRDRAVILVGFAGALRRSEIAAMQLAGPDVDADVQVSFVAQGLEISIGRSKGDQEGQGQVVAVPFGRRVCPVEALEQWLAAASITAGPVFRSVDRNGHVGESLSDRAIADLVKRAVERAGLDPKAFAGHSLRRGLLTSAARGGAAPEVLMKHARHARFETTLGYIEEANRFDRSAAGKAGL
jgi:site-specific recombinase XerD